MPDYSILKQLCEELEISTAELLDGEKNNLHSYDEHQIIDMVKRVQNLEKQRTFLIGLMLSIMGISFFTLSHFIGGSSIQDFIS